MTAARRGSIGAFVVFLLAFVATLAGLLANHITFATNDYRLIILFALACAALSIVLVLAGWRHQPAAGRAIAILMLVADAWILVDAGLRRLLGLTG